MSPRCFVSDEGLEEDIVTLNFLTSLTQLLHMKRVEIVYHRVFQLRDNELVPLFDTLRSLKVLHLNEVPTIEEVPHLTCRALLALFDVLSNLESLGLYMIPNVPLVHEGSRSSLRFSHLRTICFETSSMKICANRLR